MSAENKGATGAQKDGGTSAPSAATGKAEHHGSTVLQRYLERLHHSVRRGGLLYAFPTKSVKRLDLTRFGVADSSLPNDLLTKLIKSESSKIQFELDISETNKDVDNPQRELFFALANGLVRIAEAFRRETGVRSLWLAYPLFYARLQGEASDFTNILSPIFLWPLKIEAPLQTQGRIIISRDEDAGGPKYNKALDLWITEHLNYGPEDPRLDDFAETSRAALDEVVQRLYSGLRPAPRVSLLGEPQPIPDHKNLEDLRTPSVLNSGVVGLIQWENQALTRDLENLLKSETHTDLLNDFLSGRGRETRRSLSLPPEEDRFHVTDADPAQERAVWMARDGPGLVVHGPPGTGKSQTIVNMVADSLAHGQRVLLVCQKCAAIDVVSARLNAQHLGELVCVVHDSESDRSRIILSIKNQIADLRMSEGEIDVRARRNRLAAEIERLEKQLAEYSEAVCGLGDFGLPYRDALALITKLHSSGARVEDGLKPLFSGKTVDELRELETETKTTARLWQEAYPKTNPWRFRSGDLSIDPALRDKLHAVLDAIETADQPHQSFVQEHGAGFTITNNPTEFREKAQHWETYIKAASVAPRSELCSQWVSRARQEGVSLVDETLRTVQTVVERFHRLIRGRPDKANTQEVPCVEPLEAARWLEIVAILIEMEEKWWRWFRPRYHGLHKYLKLRLGRSSRLSLVELERFRGFYLDWLDQNLWALHFASELATAVETEPWLNQVLNHFADSDATAIGCDIQALAVAIQRAPMARAVFNAVDPLQPWFKADYLQALKAKICAGDSVAPDVMAIRDGFVGLQSLQFIDVNRQYRQGLSRGVLDVLEASESEGQPAGERWWNTVQFSAFLSWKEAWESQRPVLRQMNAAQFEQGQRRLAQILSEKRELEVAHIRLIWRTRQSNRRKGDFNGILVTRGPNSKRLRQVVELGQAVGLFDFRPCWLTNPNTASQIFPLAASFFDLVIFDEASQCPVEQAIPAIYRAGRLVVAGDEKQLPPTAFFQSGFSFGDEPDVEMEGESSFDTTGVQQKLDEASKQQALVVTDLLEASKALLPQRFLNIHYRSEHPALINFSNHAFYSGQLQIPPCVYGPAITAPLVFVEVNGVYDKKRNLKEAQQVVMLLRQIWLSDHKSPTVGVVTFNEVQRDLIEDILSEEAAKDATFQARYVAERSRVEDQQDVGFFVRNLESVQGDERDIMVFSTTFGRDSLGLFRRFFGPINQNGGERRLNVAITRAKKCNYVLTSMPINEISERLVGGTVSAGMAVSGRDYLHAYMQYVKAVSAKDSEAQKQTLNLVGRLSTTVGDSPQPGTEDSLFEAEVRDALITLGYRTATQVGDGGFRIDLAVVHRDPERGYVLGIECDGKAYHSDWTARARDVWRQRILEGRGWKIHRIWSTNWWLDRDGELRKLVARLRTLVGG